MSVDLLNVFRMLSYARALHALRIGSGVIQPTAVFHPIGGATALLTASMETMKTPVKSITIIFLCQKTPLLMNI